MKLDKKGLGNWTLHKGMAPLRKRHIKFISQESLKDCKKGEGERGDKNLTRREGGCEGRE